jgi:hypothetical protein
MFSGRIAMARMQDANLAAATIDPTKSTVTQRAARKIAEDHLNRYFDMVETELNHRRKLYAEGSRSWQTNIPQFALSARPNLPLEQHRHLDQSVSPRLHRSSLSNQRCGAACWKSSRVPAPEFITTANNRQSPTSYRVHAMSAGARRANTPPALMPAISFITCLSTAHGDQSIGNRALWVGGRQEHLDTDRCEPSRVAR